MKAIIFALLVFLAIGLTSCAVAEPATLTSPPTATILPLPASTETASATPTLSGVQKWPEYNYPDGGPGAKVPAGEYKTPGWFSMPFTFETDQPLGAIGEDDPKGELFGLGKSHISLITFFAVDPTISAEDTISLLRETPDFDISPNESVEIAGIMGTQFDLGDKGGRVPAIATLIGHPVYEYENNWLLVPHVYARYIVLEVNGRALLIEITERTDDFDSWFAEMEQLLQTIEFIATTG